MDSIEESAQCSDPSVMLASVECVGALLGSLEALCKGEGLNQEAAELTNSRYPLLVQADYTGPLTYQSLARLPKPYRDVVANLRYQNDSDSSGIEGGVPDVEGGSESDCSGVTEGPEECGSQSDDSIMDDDSFLTSQQLQKLHKLPKSLNLVIPLAIPQLTTIIIITFRDAPVWKNATQIWKGIMQGTTSKLYKTSCFQISYRCDPPYKSMKSCKNSHLNVASTIQHKITKSQPL